MKIYVFDDFIPKNDTRELPCIGKAEISLIIISFYYDDYCYYVHTIIVIIVAIGKLLETHFYEIHLSQK